ncbi:MAG: hypothetical protein U5L76_06005 [Patescibacteria group bacterium]|nr:hypothetical protein [Patescibacteria group bacterium]
MIKLNLLSNQKKKELKEYKILNTFRIASYLVIVFLVLIIMSLYGVSYYLSNQVKEISDKNEASQNRQSQEGNISYSKTISEINSDIQDIKKIQSDYIIFSDYLKDYTKIIPSDLKLTNLSVNNETNLIQIKGLAPTREVFLQFKTNLENSNLIKEIDSPISNLIKKVNVDFTISGKMILDSYNINNYEI